MASTDSERIPCPTCGKTYRWKPELASRKVVCKACQTAFTFPAQPIKEEAAPAADDASLYELAGDPDKDRELPPAYEVPEDLKKETPPPAAPPPMAPPVEPLEHEASSGTEPSGEEAEVYVSESVKAARREQQRIARAEEDSVRTWRDYKLLYIILLALVLFAILLWAMDRFGDAVDEGLHKTMRENSDMRIAATPFMTPGLEDE